MKKFAIGYLIGLIVTALFSYPHIKNKQPQPQPTPCPSEKEIILKYEKYQMFVDSMTIVKKKDIERLSDSLVKYRIND